MVCETPPMPDGEKVPPQSMIPFLQNYAFDFDGSSTQYV